MLNRFRSVSAVVLATMTMSVAAQGDLVTEGLVAHAAKSIAATGAGLTVGVIAAPISQTKLNALTTLPEPELPTVDVLLGAARDDSAEQAFLGSDTGLDVLQIVHDMAPGATLVFVAPQDVDPEGTPASEAAAFQAALDALTGYNTTGVDIIVDAYQLTDTEETVFWDDDLARAVEAVADDVVYVVAAGDEGNIQSDSAYISATVYESRFVGTGVPSTVNLGAGFEYIELAQNFNGTGDALLTINQDLKRLCLYWADQPDGSYNDYDLFVIGDDPATQVADKVVLASSTDFQYLDGNHRPRECIPSLGDATNAGADALVAGNEILIGTDSIASEGRYLHLHGEMTDAAVAALSRTAASNERGISNPPQVFEMTTAGAIRGRAGLPNVITVASAPVQRNSSGAAREFRAGDPVSDITTVGDRVVFWQRDANDTAWIEVGGANADLNPADPDVSNADTRAKPDVVGADVVRVYRIAGDPAAPQALRGEIAVGSAVAAAHVGGLTARILEGEGIYNPEVFAGLLDNTFDTGLAGVDVGSGAGAPNAADALTQIALPLAPVDLSITVGNGSATLNFSAPPDDAGDSYDYTASCFYSEAGLPDVAAFMGEVVTTDGYSFAVPPNSTVRCELVATNSVAAVDPASVNTGTNTVADLNPPVIDRVDGEPFGFTVRYTVDGFGIPGFTYNNTLVCTSGGSDAQTDPLVYVLGGLNQEDPPQPVGVALPDSPASFDERDGDIKNDVELSCVAKIVTNILGGPEPSGSAELPFTVTPEAISGLPIWLLYEATKQNQPPQ